MSGAFADRLIERARALGPLCVGLDPFPERIPALFGPDPVRAIEDFCGEVLSLAASQAAAVKPQLGLFEPFGADGVAAAQRLCARARHLGLPVILDAKRGDIGTTADGYAEAALGEAFGADCVTVNPYMGLDTLEPFVARAASRGKGVAVLVRTSNPGAADFQELDCGGAPLWARVAERLQPLAARLADGDGWSGLMAVVGATAPQEAREARRLMPRNLFLVPGFGAQGATAEEALAGFVPGPAGLEGGVVNASRSVLYPDAARSAGDVVSWRSAISQAMRESREALRIAAGMR